MDPGAPAPATGNSSEGAPPADGGGGLLARLRSLFPEPSKLVDSALALGLATAFLYALGMAYMTGYMGSLNFPPGALFEPPLYLSVAWSLILEYLLMGALVWLATAAWPRAARLAANAAALVLLGLAAVNLTSLVVPNLGFMLSGGFPGLSLTILLVLLLLVAAFALVARLTWRRTPLVAAASRHVSAGGPTRAVAYAVVAFVAFTTLAYATGAANALTQTVPPNARMVDLHFQEPSDGEGDPLVLLFENGGLLYLAEPADPPRGPARVYVVPSDVLRGVEIHRMPAGEAGTAPPPPRIL